MLTELRICDFAIIEHLELSFDPGFVVFTGETGAGKSIIIDAVGMLLGERAESTAVRTGADKALIEGSFRLEPEIRQEVDVILDREGLKEDQDHLTLGREIRRRGRSVCRVNGRSVNLGLLREIGDCLVDVHGQSEHLSLLRVKEHINLLDRYAQNETLRKQFADVYRSLTRVRRELDDLRRREQEAETRAEFLRFRINEIDAAALDPDEETHLEEERIRLANAEQLVRLAEQALAALDEDPHAESASLDQMGRAVSSLQALAKVDPSMSEAHAEAQGLMEQMADVARRLKDYREQVEFNPTRLDFVEERLGLIRSLERKYGGTIKTVLEAAQSARRELEAITHAEERIQVLERDEGELLIQLAEEGKNLSRARRQAAEALTEAIESELTDLNMAGARFHTELQRKEDPEGVPLGEKRVGFGPDGLDRVEFLVSPNPGEALKPLVKIASGGETSRMMLGLKSVLARADRTPALIFDEIDQGIGGRVGAVVGRKLWALASSHQVLCVTHLPQLAAYGDQHLKVEKRLKDERTITVVSSLAGEKRVAELAQMLGGSGHPTHDSAEVLLRQAEAVKRGAAVG